MKDRFLDDYMATAIILRQSNEIDPTFWGVDVCELDCHRELAASWGTHYRGSEFPVRDQASHGLTDLNPQSAWRVGYIELHPLNVGDLRA